MADDTLTTTMSQLRTEGYTNDLTATTDGNFACADCGAVENPANVQIDQTIRFEGDTDPGDAAILLAITCECGIRGLYTAAYGADTPAADSRALRRLAAKDRTDRPTP